MKPEVLQYILKLVSQDVVKVEPDSDRTRLVVNDQKYLVRYYPSDNDHDFITECISVLEDHINITGMDIRYYKNNQKLEELSSDNFFVYKQTTI
jgi:hypothetical protein